MNEPSASSTGSVTGATVVATDAVPELIRKLKSENNEIRARAWFECGPLGAPTIPPLAAVWANPGAGLEVQRAARHAVVQIVRCSSRPEARKSRKAVITELHRLLEADGPSQMRRELLWLLSEIADDESLSILSRLLNQEAVREEACMTLEPIPGKSSLKILTTALTQAPADFQPVLAASLARRGQIVSGVPSGRLVPTAQTHVQPLSQPRPEN